LNRLKTQLLLLGTLDAKIIEKNITIESDKQNLDLNKPHEERIGIKRYDQQSLYFLDSCLEFNSFHNLKK
jgi:hypothetical protein